MDKINRNFFADSSKNKPSKLDNERCNICPMISEYCLKEPCAIYNVKLTDKERINPEEIRGTLWSALAEKVKKHDISDNDMLNALVTYYGTPFIVPKY